MLVRKRKLWYDWTKCRCDYDMVKRMYSLMERKYERNKDGEIWDDKDTDC